MKAPLLPSSDSDAHKLVRHRCGAGLTSTLSRMLACCHGTLRLLLRPSRAVPHWASPKMSGPCGREAHEHGHGHGHDHSKCDHTNDDKESESVVAGISLQQYIDIENCRCSNVSEPGELRKIFKSYEDRRSPEGFIESDCDEELLIFIPFTEVLRIKGLIFVGGTGENDDSAPASAKLYINRDDIDFDKAAETTPVQELQLQNGALSDMEYPLKTSKFTAVRNLTIVVPANFGAETTIVSCVHFRGASTKISTNRVILEAVYEAQGRLEDHKVRGVGEAMREAM